MTKSIWFLCMRGLAAAMLAGFTSATTSFADAPKTHLNIVLILADDLGWTDLGCYGSDLYQTPNIDRLAQDGMRFTQAYSACTVCSPTRAALMSGEYPARLHVTDWIPGRLPANPKLQIPEWTKHLPLGTLTVADCFRQGGYATVSIGKWHLGNESYYPKKFGFDLNIAGTSAGNPSSGYFSPYKIDTLADGPPGEYLTDRIGAEAVNYIERHRDKPFFLYLPEFAVHTPIQGKEAITAKYRSKAGMGGQRHTNAEYAAMIESMDDTVGRVRAKLQELGLSDQTIVIFASDNGGHLPTTNNTPLRVGKGSCYEGGVRVPFIVYWPHVTKVGATSDVPTISMDIFPTILAAVGLSLPADHVLDGISLEPVLRGKGSLPPRPLYWHYPHYQLYQQGGTVPYSAVRDGDYKLIKFYDGRGMELYNIRGDIGESSNLATSRPELAQRLEQQLNGWLKSVGAQLPSPNPKYDPTRPENPPGRRPKESDG